MPKNVMKLIKPSPHRGRNDFDLSHRTILDMNFGALHVPSCVETVPNDDYKIGVADLLRTNAMVTSPFLRAKQHIDIWWVPYHDLWHNFEQFMVQREQPVSSALSGSSFCPHASMYDLWRAAQNSAFTGSLTTDIVGQDFAKGAQGLLQELGYGYDLLGSNHDSQAKVNLFRLAAYNYIWYNEYRQQYYDDGKRGLGTASPALLFNFDDLACTSEATADLTFSSYATRLNSMVQRRYRCWKKDLFTGLMPATQFGSVSTVGTLNNITVPASGTRDFLSINSAGNLAALNITDGQNVNTSNINGSATYPIANFDVLALRRSEAVQIWRENALRAGNRVWDNYQAHYGVESYFRDHRPTHIASIDAPLNISDVMTTATTNTGINDTVGDIGGKGLCSLDKGNIKFHSSDFGVIMCIASILPEAEYNQQGIDRCNQLLESEDFFIPEYENLGLEAVSSQCFKNTPVNIAKVVGYAPRYFGYKTKIDRCLGTFMTGAVNSSWCSPKSDVSTVFITPPTAIPLNTLYVNPALYDVNFTVGLSVMPQFKADFYFDVDAVRPMSVTGLPFS